MVLLPSTRKSVPGVNVFYLSPLSIASLGQKENTPTQYDLVVLNVGIKHTKLKRGASRLPFFY